MRAVLGVLLLGLLGPLSLAHADVIVDGTVSTTDQGATPCSSSGAAPGSLGLACLSAVAGTSASASVQGAGGAFAGSIGAHTDVIGPPFTEPGMSHGFMQLDLNGNYVLTGGTGTTTIEFTITTPVPNTTSQSCSFSFNGVAAPGCDPVFDSFSETVQYGVPFSIAMDLQISASSLNGEPSDGTISYDFNQPGLQATPEPSSVMLLLPGLVGVFCAARLRRPQSGTR